MIANTIGFWPGGLVDPEREVCPLMDIIASICLLGFARPPREMMRSVTNDLIIDGREAGSHYQSRTTTNASPRPLFPVCSLRFRRLGIREKPPCALVMDVDGMTWTSWQGLRFANAHPFLGI